MVTKSDIQGKEEEIIESMKASLDEAEAFLREAASATGDKAAELRESAMTSLRRTRESLRDTQDAMLERGRRAAQCTDEYVHDNPWQSVAFAGVAGLVLGVLLCRR